MIAASSAYQAELASMTDEPKTPIYLLEITGYARAFTSQPTGISGQYDWIESIDDFTINVSDLDGGVDQATLTVTIQDVGRAITADFPSNTLEGKKVTLKDGFSGMSQSDFVTRFTGKIDHVESTNSNGSYNFVCVDNRVLLDAVIFTTGDDGQPIDNDHPHTILAHPLDILLYILETELSISTSDIDVAKIQDYRDNIFSGLIFSFTLTSAPTAKDFIEQELMKPLAAYIWTNNLGKFTVNFFYQESASSVASLGNDDDDGEIPDVVQADLINVVTVRFDKSTDNNGSFGDSFFAEDTEQYGASIAKYGQFGATTIESQGLRSAFQGFLQAKYLTRFIFYRYGLKTLKIDEMGFLWTASLLEPGDLVTVTNSHIPDRGAGVMGITNKVFEVLDRAWSFSNGTVKLTLLDASYLSKFGRYLIAPNGEANFTAASSIDKGKYMFLCNNSDQYSDTTAAHPLG